MTPKSSTVKSGLETDQKSGQAMDRRIEKKNTLFSTRNMMIAAGLVGALVLYLAFAPESGRLYKIDGDRVVVAPVVMGQFEDFIPVRGRVTPAQTVFLDTVEGGRVEKIHVEDGATVTAGQILVDLSNTSLQLDVISREAQVTEQLNNLKTIELSLEQNRLSHKRNLIEIDYQITRLSRQVARRKQLAVRGNVSIADLENAQDELAYFKKRHAITLESQASDEKMQQQQMKQLINSTEQLKKNLIFARRNLDNLVVRAPVNGKLTAFDAVIGQSMDRGQRLGQIDDPDHFKIKAQIDEFYLGRVDVGQRALVKVGGQELTLKVKKTYPQVNNGQFEIDMTFTGPTPRGIRRGQTVQSKLFLGDTGKAMVIPNGSFYADTGGSWIFVVSPDGTKAVRRDVRLGRRNSKVIEVIDGLQPGEKVIVSPYTNYIDMDRLELTGVN
ncbi:MAG: efflux transporter periplasmic adaptor subunit [Alphaproteobacteria bacterium]|nr:MAG: efflux transporter periplasmic adaptor subunit [Alphaproteobacteria bacterium]